MTASSLLHTSFQKTLGLPNITAPLDMPLLTRKVNIKLKLFMYGAWMNYDRGIEGNGQ